MRLFDGFGAFRAALSHRNYRLYTAGNAVSLIGTWMQMLAVGWLAWELTHSPAWLGAIVFLELAPAVILSPFGGALADRFDRVRIMLATDGFGMLMAASLATLSLANLITIELLCAAVLINGAALALRQPARLALPPALVPRADLGGAIALNSLVFNAARFVGPAIAGLVIAQFGVAVAFAVNAVTYVVFLVALLALRLEARPRVEPALSSSLNPFVSLAGALSYVAGHRALTPLLGSLFVFCVLARPISEMMPGVNAELFLGDASTLGLLTASVGIGAMLGGLFVGGRRGPGTIARDVFLGQALAGAAVVGVTFAPDLMLGLPLVAAAGFGMVMAGVSTQTAIQLAVDDRMRGRVISLYGMTFRAGPALGALVIGATGEHVGLGPPLAVAAGLAILVGLMGYAVRERVQAAIAE